MKINFFQKTTLVTFIVCLTVFSIWFVPYREITTIYHGHHKTYEKEIIFDSLFSNNYNIDLYRTSIILILIVLFFATTFLLLSKLPNPDFNNPEIKKKVKREFFYLCYLTAILIGANAYCYIKNFVYLIKIDNQESCHKQISEIEETNTYFTEKRNSRTDFFNAMEESFDIKNDSTPDLLIKVMSDSAGKVKWDVVFNRINVYFKQRYDLKDSLEIENFVHNLKYSQKDSTLLEKLNKLNLERSESIDYTKWNPYLYKNDFVRIIFKAGIIGFLILFVGRALYYKFKVFIKYLKET